MRGYIEYSDELHPPSSHRTPGQIAEDEAGPIGGFLHHTLIDEQARLLEESIERTAESGAGRLNVLRARRSTNTIVSAFRHQRNENP